MWCKWYFRDELSPSFSEVLLFNLNLIGIHHLNILVWNCFLVNWKVSCFSFCQVNLKLNNLTKEEWLAMKSLAKDQSIIIKHQLIRVPV